MYAKLITQFVLSLQFGIVSFFLFFGIYINEKIFYNHPVISVPD
jgi:hypothetical protein